MTVELFEVFAIDVDLILVDELRYREIFIVCDVVFDVLNSLSELFEVHDFFLYGPYVLHMSSMSFIIIPWETYDFFMGYQVLYADSVPVSTSL